MRSRKLRPLHTQSSQLHWQTVIATFYVPFPSPSWPITECIERNESSRIGSCLLWQPSWASFLKTWNVIYYDRRLDATTGGSRGESCWWKGYLCVNIRFIPYFLINLIVQLKLGSQFCSENSDDGSPDLNSSWFLLDEPFSKIIFGGQVLLDNFMSGCFVPVPDAACILIYCFLLPIYSCLCACFKLLVRSCSNDFNY